jgi:hypothetical protein
LFPLSANQLARGVGSLPSGIQKFRGIVAHGISFAIDGVLC